MENSLFSPVRGNIHFACHILKILEAEMQRNPDFLRFAFKRYLFCFKRVVRLDGCVVFSEIKPKTLNLEWKLVVVASFPNGIRKSRKCHFSHYEMDGLEGSESALFRKINMVLPFKAKKVTFWEEIVKIVKSRFQIIKISLVL